MGPLRLYSVSRCVLCFAFVVTEQVGDHGAAGFHGLFWLATATVGPTSSLYVAWRGEDWCVCRGCCLLF